MSYVIVSSIYHCFFDFLLSFHFVTEISLIRNLICYLFLFLRLDELLSFIFLDFFISFAAHFALNPSLYFSLHLPRHHHASRRLSTPASSRDLPTMTSTQKKQTHHIFQPFLSHRPSDPNSSLSISLSDPQSRVAACSPSGFESRVVLLIEVVRIDRLGGRPKFGVEEK